MRALTNLKPHHLGLYFNFYRELVLFPRIDRGCSIGGRNRILLELSYLCKTTGRKFYIYSDTSTSLTAFFYFFFLPLIGAITHRWTRCAVSRFLFTRSHELSSDRSKFSSYYLASTIGYRRSKRHAWYRCVGRIYDSRLFLFRFRAHCYGRRRSKCRRNDDIKVAFETIESHFSRFLSDTLIEWLSGIIVISSTRKRNCYKNVTSDKFSIWWNLTIHFHNFKVQY